MIYVTGDTHGGFRRFDKDIFPEKLNMTKDDYVIICGDFGGVWTGDNYGNNTCTENDYGFFEEYSEWITLNALEHQPFTTLFVSGNHENFDALSKYPDKEWHGGIVKEIRPSVLLLKRGYVFDIEGKKFFTFGGAKSHDISGGVYEPDDIRDIQRAKRSYEPFRVNHISWWEEEEPSDEEMKRGLKNLDANNWDIDFVVTHECSSSNLYLLYSHLGGAQTYTLTNYLEEIRCKLNYKRWFFGHHHDNKAINDKDIMLYEQIIRIH